jgi:predicted RND superfamily exporter protein
MTIRQRVELAFEAWGHWVYRHPKRTIGAVMVLVGLLITQLPAISFDSSLESFLHEDDPLRLRYEEFRREFGRDDLVIVAVDTTDIFSFDVIEKLRALHRDLEENVPHLSEITSLLNARETRGEGDELIVGELMKDWPETPAELASLRSRALANRIYQNLLIAGDGRITAILLEANAYSIPDSDDDVLAGFEDEAADVDVADRPTPFLTEKENGAFVRTIESIVRDHQAPGFRLHISGMSAVSDYLMRSMRADMMRFTIYGIIAIAIFLTILFQRFVGVAIPLLVVILSMLCTISLMPLIDQPITLPTQILPSFLLAVGVGDAVHVLVIFFQRLHRGDQKEDAIAYALGHSGLAVVMTSLTTAGALLSFAAAEMAPVAALGVIAPAGVMVALIFTVVLLPALVAVFPIGAGDEGDRRRSRATQRLLVRCGELAVSHAGLVLASSFVIACVAALGATQLRLSHSPIKWFPENNSYRVATDFMNAEMGGAMFLEVLLDTGVENGLHEPRRLRQLDEMRHAVSAVNEGDVFAGKTVSVADIAMEIHQALNENRPEYYAIPEARELVAQELLLFENAGSDDLEDFVDPQFRTSRFTVKIPMVDAVQYAPYLDALRVEIERIVGNEVDVTFTGLMRVISGTVYAMMITMARSYMIAFAVITPLMILLIGHLRLGLLSMIPNLVPILLVLGIMGWIGVPLDAFTLLIGSIAIGLAVDDTIHFMHNFRRYYERSGDVHTAVRDTLESTGQALLFTSLVLSTGFFIFTFASLSSLFFFGLLTGTAIIFAFLADVILAPALMAVVVGRWMKRPAQAGTVEAPR